MFLVIQLLNVFLKMKGKWVANIVLRVEEKMDYTKEQKI